MERPKVLITGINGKIAQVLVRELSGEWDIYGIDLEGDGERTLAADLSDWHQLEDAFGRIGRPDAVIHLGAIASSRASWDDVLKNNIIGTRYVYENAKNIGAGKVIFASSVHVMGGYDYEYLGSGKLLSADAPIRPDGDYGTSKAFGEALARQYWENYRLPSVCLRIGNVTREDDPRGDERLMAIWLSHRDLVHLMHRCLLADVDYGVYFACSGNTTRFWDLSLTERDLGYESRDDSSRL
ncbi:MAG TPA: NAD(P)-dependent oxidoreductase [Candidatus Paceibacterota bacterium]|nr:NAD(P)-dependent oxidoreductase [Candidatus Paceibacterota bacterium]